jgi:hypothetical protein
MSEGQLGFQQARKIEDTPFPFPYAQVATRTSAKATPQPARSSPPPYLCASMHVMTACSSLTLTLGPHLPHAQLLAFMLYAFGLLFPLLAASKVGNEQSQGWSTLEGRFGKLARSHQPWSHHL